MTPKSHNLSPLIDEVGTLQAKVADLTSRIDEIKATLKELGAGAYEGELFRVTISTAARSNLDLDAVRKKLSRQFILAHTKESLVTSVKVTARTGKEIA